MSKIEVDQVDPQSGTTLTLGTSGDTVNIPSGVTITNNGTQTGFGRTGSVDWQSTIKTGNFTAVSGEGYFVNTTSGAITLTLPSSPSVGDIVGFKDYANTFSSNNLTIGRNSQPIEGTAEDSVVSTGGVAVLCVYADSTKGWLVTSSGNKTDMPQTYSLQMLVIAGGAGGGGNYYGGGGGAGGYRESTQNVSAGNTLSISVGDGGAGGTGNNKGTSGSNSSISGTGITTITSAGGGGGGGDSGNKVGNDGGSGGGSSGYNSDSSGGGSGNTPSTTPSQGNNGGSNTYSGKYGGAGGGGAGAVGGSTANDNGAAGGAGSASSITGSSVTRAGGGGGSGSNNGSAGGTIGAGGSGGGGAGARETPSVGATAGTANTGGGGGGGAQSSGAAGGKGVVILSIPTSDYSGTVTGSPTVTTSGSNTIVQFNGTGTIVT